MRVVVCTLYCLQGMELSGRPAAQSGSVKKFSSGPYVSSKSSSSVKAGHRRRLSATVSAAVAPSHAKVQSSSDS